MRLVLDTNVLIAAFISRGTCAELFIHCGKHHSLVVSDFILDEFTRILRDKFNISSRHTEQAARLIKSRAICVKPEELPADTCRDRDDIQVLGTAMSGNCRAIITGDKDLLILHPWRKIAILAPNEFWKQEQALSEST